MKCYLAYAGMRDATYEPHRSLEEAKAEFFAAATQLDNFGQKLEASLHIAPCCLDINEYPDYLLSLGKHGALRCERA